MRSPPGPPGFSLRGLTPHRFECSGIRPAYMLRFRSHGRFFQVQIAFGPGASPATRAKAMRSLSSLRVGSGGG